MGGQTEMMISTTEADQQSAHSLLGAKVKEGIDSRGPQRFLATLQMAHPLQEETTQIDRANEVCNIHINEGFSDEWLIRANSEKLLGKG